MSSFNLPPKPGSPLSISPPVLSQDEPSSSLPTAFNPAVNLYNRFWSWRKTLELPNPGNAENLTKEVKSTHLTNFMFDGLRVDYAKAFSHNPAFQITHGLTLASQTQEPSYNFSSLFISEKTFMQGSLDHEGSLSGRFTQQWSTADTTKGQMQLGSSADRSALQVEHDHAGLDFNVNMKAINPSIVDGSGVYIGSYLQSLTKNLALGFETVMQRGPDGQDLGTTYLAKYTGDAKDWIATAQVQPIGLLQTSYWQKLSPQVEVAADLQLIAAPMKRDAVATVGAKWDLRMSSFKAQVDSTGKVSALLEQRLAPNFALLFSGEIDHFKNTSKVGVGVMLEANAAYDEEMMSKLPPQL
ncbi:translocase of outer mitochondrial membrane [Serendipita sp. 401]|nr:translocase of outer mitochondrial membrane [Serendipita sp. 401]